jgi:hypothetical protein
MENCAPPKEIGSRGPAYTRDIELPNRVHDRNDKFELQLTKSNTEMPAPMRRPARTENELAHCEKLSNEQLLPIRECARMLQVLPSCMNPSRLSEISSLCVPINDNPEPSRVAVRKLMLDPQSK